MYVGHKTSAPRSVRRLRKLITVTTDDGCTDKSASVVTDIIVRWEWTERLNEQDGKE